MTANLLSETWTNLDSSELRLLLNIRIGGPGQFPKAAEENNAENLLIIHDKKLAERYTKNWQEHAHHSEVYAGRGR